MERKMQRFERPQGGDGLSQAAGEQAQSFGQEARAAAAQAGEQVTSTVQEQAAKVADKARMVAADAGNKIQRAVNDQRASGADYLRNVAGLVHQAADVFDREVPQASHYIHQAAHQLDTVAETVRTKNLHEALSDMQDFARRQPAIFFGGALLLGFAAVRVFKSSAPGSAGESPYAGP
jgi:hypothetical protein